MSRRKARFVRCKYCNASVKEENIKSHIWKVHTDSLKQEFSQSSTKELINELIACGRRVAYGLAEEISKREDSTPYLMEILNNERYWSGEAGEDESWMPIHALHLLSASRNMEGLKANIVVLHTKHEELGDWLTEGVPAILANFGRPAFEVLRETLFNTMLDPFVRNAAGRAMAVIPAFR